MLFMTVRYAGIWITGSRIEPDHSMVAINGSEKHPLFIGIALISLHSQ
jgi:hypothetical protein